MANGLLLEPIAMTSITASNTATGYSADNVANDFMGMVWRSNTGASSRTLTIDLGADTTLNTIVLLGLNGAQSSWDWQIELATAAQGAFSGAHWDGSDEDLLAGATMPVNGKGKALWQAPGDAPTAARYVRITFKNLSSAAVEVSRVIIAAKIQPARNFRYGLAQGLRPTGSLEFSARGVAQRRTGVQLRGISVTYEAATQAEAEGLFLPLFERVGNTSPVCLVMDPDANAQRQNRIYFGYLQGDLGSVWSRMEGHTASFNIVGPA